MYNKTHCIMNIPKIFHYNTIVWPAVYYWLGPKLYEVTSELVDFYLVEIISVWQTPRPMVLLPCRTLMGFISSLAIYFNIHSSVSAFTQFLKCSWNQLYHPAGSLINELNKSLTYIHSTFGRGGEGKEE